MDFFTPRGGAAFITTLSLSVVGGLIYLSIKLVLKKIKSGQKDKRPKMRINLLNQKSRKRIKQVITEREKEKKN